MKFEHVLQIYWSKGFLINGKLQSFQTDFNSMFSLTGGFSWGTKNLLIRRFELYKLLRVTSTPLLEISPTFSTSINPMFAQLTSVNNSIFELTRLNLLRLYLIKTTRGRSHALGKPSRGQRTWSNAWTAYNTNKTTRAFISAYQKLEKANAKEEKINYKLIKKKSLLRKKKETVTKVRIRVNNWF